MSAAHPSPQPRSRFGLGLIAGVLTGLVLLGLAWLALPPKTPVTATPAPTSASPTPTPTPTPTPSDTGTPSASPTPSGTPSAVPGLVTSLPKGSYIAVLSSMRKNRTTPEQAVAYAASLSRGSYTVSAIDADVVPGLNGGNYAIGITGLTSRDAVRNVCPAFNRPYGDTCYARIVGG